MATTKDHKINLTSMLGAMDRRQIDWFDNLDDEQKKEFEPWMAMRFASSVDGSQGIKEHYLLCTNDFVNRNFGAISIKEHKELHWLCLRTVGIGKSVIHPFVKPPKRATKNKLQTWLIEKFPHLSNDEIDLMIAVNSKEAFKDYAKQLNLDPKQIKELF